MQSSLNRSKILWEIQQEIAFSGVVVTKAREGNSVLRGIKDTKSAGISLHGEILPRLRDFIVEGNLGDGARIPERQLCDMFGVSRTPLREALKVLASEGLIDLLPHRGARVRALGARELAELFDVMGGLEALAGRLACERITPTEFSEIEQMHHQMYRFYLNRDMPAYFRCNQLIHEKIVAAARNAALSSAYASLAGRIRRVRYAANLAQKRDRWGEAVREHEAILDSLRRRDGLELSDILFRHLRNKQAAAIEYLDDARDGEPAERSVAADLL
jgi:DNA-binding GntR family transcriptional regulator